jgi:hypothetical protein
MPAATGCALRNRTLGENLAREAILLGVADPGNEVTDV